MVHRFLKFSAIDNKCVNTIGSFQCECFEGYERALDGSGCKDIDECADNNGGCSHQCKNLDGSHECLCNAGYEEDLVSFGMCRDFNECEINNGGCEHECQNTEGSYFCKCDVGFRAVDGKCVDVDEFVVLQIYQFESENSKNIFFNSLCQEKPDICPEGVTCTNTIGSFQCYRCPIGQIRINDICTDMDECSYENGGCSHDCTNTENSFYCSCPNGYFLGEDMKTCQNIDECEKIKPCRGDKAKCVDTNGSYRCECEKGYKLLADEHTCADINECVQKDFDSCQVNSVCINLPGSFKCRCIHGYKTLPNGACELNNALVDREEV